MPPKRELTLWETGYGHCEADRYHVWLGLEAMLGPPLPPFWHHSHFREQGLSSWYEREGCNLGAHQQAGWAL